MALPVGLSVGQTHSVGGVDVQVVSIEDNGEYRIRFIGISSKLLTFEQIKSTTLSVFVVSDAGYPEMNGLWIKSNGNFEKQTYTYIPW